MTSVDYSLRDGTSLLYIGDASYYPRIGERVVINAKAYRVSDISHNPAYSEIVVFVEPEGVKV